MLHDGTSPPDGSILPSRPSLLDPPRLDSKVLECFTYEDATVLRGASKMFDAITWALRNRWTLFPLTPVRLSRTKLTFAEVVKMRRMSR